MKKLQLIFKAFVWLFCFFLAETGWAQNVGISSASGFTPDASAGLDISFTNKGLLIPRVALTATSAAGPVSSPTTSLLVYNTATAGTAPNNVIPGYYYWNGVAWTMLSTSAQTAASTWLTTGNAGTSYPTNYLGTTDNFGLHFKTAATHRFWIDSLGSVAVGLYPMFTSGAAREKFLVDAGSVNYPTPTGAYNVISGKGYLDNYLQLNIQNTSPTAAASSDIVASNDAATETANYVDMGINSSANSSTGVIGGANTAYLYGAGNDFAIGNGTAGKNLLFFTGGTAGNERMRIDGTGNVGIGNILPTQKLDVTGNLKFSGALMPNNTAGTAGYFLVSSGANAAPTWYNATAYINTAAWVLAGNAGTNAGTNFIGTTDAVDFVMKTSNLERARITSSGNVGIGSTAFNTTNSEKLLVDAGSTAQTSTNSFNVISGKGYIDKYLQLNIQNLAPTGSASSDIVASNDQATEAINFVDLGINSSGNTSTGVLGGANTAYLLATGSDFAIGNGTTNKDLIFFTTTTATGNTESTRIDGATGNVGIGTSNPTAKLHLNGANPLKINNVALGTNTATDSLLTITNGLVMKLPLSTFASATNAISSINGLTATTQSFAVGTSGTSFNITSSGATHTFNIPDASATARGEVTTLAQTLAGSKTFSSAPLFSSLTAGSIPYIGTGGLVSQNNAALFWDATNSRLGTGTATPLSTLDVNGSVAHAITLAPGAVSLTAANYTVILQSTLGITVTLPPANTCARRIYVLVNQSIVKLTNIAYIPFAAGGGTTTTIPANSSITIQSDGINWYRIQ